MGKRVGPSFTSAGLLEHLPLSEQARVLEQTGFWEQCEVLEQTANFRSRLFLWSKALRSVADVSSGEARHGLSLHICPPGPDDPPAQGATVDRPVYVLYEEPPTLLTR